MRKDRAEHLKIQLLRSDQMLDSDLLELRVDIKVRVYCSQMQSQSAHILLSGITVFPYNSQEYKGIHPQRFHVCSLQSTIII